VTWLAKQDNSRGLSLCAAVCCALANGTGRLLIYGVAEVRRLERSYGVTGYVPEGRSELGEDKG
jgi:hypothetical protein